MKSINIKGPSFINILVSDHNKYTKEPFILLMASTSSSKAIMFLAFQTVQKIHKGPTLQSTFYLQEEWDTACSNKTKGGLGVRRLSLLNKALLCKWNLHFAMEREVFWRQIINGKYEEVEEGWCFKEVRNSYGVRLWEDYKEIMGDCQQ